MMQVVYLCKLFMDVCKLGKGPLVEYEGEKDHWTSMAQAIFLNNPGPPVLTCSLLKGLLTLVKPRMSCSLLVASQSGHKGLEIPFCPYTRGYQLPGDWIVLIKLPGDWHPKPSLLTPSEERSLAVTKYSAAIFVIVPAVSALSSQERGLHVE